MIFILIGAIVFTAFLDFKVQDTEYTWKCHIYAIQQLLDTQYGNMSALYLFIIYLVSLVQIANAFTFSKKQAPSSLYLITGLTAVQIILVALYTSVFFVETTIRSDYSIDLFTQRSFTIMIIGAVFFLIGTIFAWFYVNWKYVKEVDE